MGNWREKKNLVFVSNAIAGEVGELCSLTKTLYGGGTNDKPLPTRKEMIKEIFDIFVYLVIFIELSGSSQDEFIDISYEKLRELYKRKGVDPDGS